MPQPAVRLQFPPRPSHVRVARMVAATAARRVGLLEERVPDLKLAVGEACTRALGRCDAARVTTRLLLTVGEAEHGLTVEVTDHVGERQEANPLHIALMQQMADAVEVLDGPCGPGGLVRLEWWA